MNAGWLTTKLENGKLWVDQMTKEFLTPHEVAARYNETISVRTLANWRSSKNSPPYVKVGGRVLYPIEKLIEWEKKRTLSII
jgi:hypothetical protein